MLIVVAVVLPFARHASASWRDDHGSLSHSPRTPGGTPRSAVDSPVAAVPATLRPIALVAAPPSAPRPFRPLAVPFVPPRG
jgi:hypothetical protein